MGKRIELITSNYADSIKTILQQYDAFCKAYELDDFDIQLERNEKTIDVTWVISPDGVLSIDEVYDNYLSFVNQTNEDVELAEVGFDGEEYFIEYHIKRTYVLSSF